MAVLVAGGARSVLADARLGDNDIRLSGCLVRGEGRGYLLTSVPGEPAWQRTSEGAVLPDAVGTAGAVATVFYWLEDHDDLARHAGNHVEIEGDLAQDTEDGSITIQRRDGSTEVVVNAASGDLHARLPQLLAAASEAGLDQRTVLVRRVKVARVGIVSLGCGS
jgi:hypothetical protein